MRAESNSGKQQARHRTGGRMGRDPGSWCVAACGSTELAEVLTPSLSEAEGRQVAVSVSNPSP